MAKRSVAKVEQRTFRAHDNHLRNTVLRQAGTLWKAILEGVMNSVDAGATECNIELSRTKLVIVDNGRGFRNQREIAEHFEMFGTPHENGDAVYGEFRMGRGQLMAFGKNVWRTGKFVMHVDIKNDGMSYRLETNKSSQPGCRIDIELYDSLSNAELVEAAKELRKFVKYVSIPIYLNTELISTDPAEEKWDHDTELCYVRLKDTGDLAVYNLGVFVCQLSSWEYGVGGEVVAKHRLKLNFARNDVMRRGHERCPVWRQIEPYLKKTADTRIRSKSLNDAGRYRLAQQIIAGESPSNGLDLKLFTDVCGRQWSIRQLSSLGLYYASASAEGYACYSVAPHGSRAGDKLHQTKCAFVFSDRTLDRFHWSMDDAPQLMSLIAKMGRQLGATEYSQSARSFTLPYRDLQELRAGLRETNDIIPEKDYTPTERLLIGAINARQTDIYLYIRSALDVKNLRHIRLGDSDTHYAWTDGSSYIAFSRQFLRSVDCDLRGLIRIGQTLLHEYCHVADDLADHDHDAEFYQKFHDHAHLATNFGLNVAAGLPQVLKAQGRRVSKSMAALVDYVETADALPKKLAELATAAKAVEKAKKLRNTARICRKKSTKVVATKRQAKSRTSARPKSR